MWCCITLINLGISYKYKKLKVQNIFKEGEQQGKLSRRFSTVRTLQFFLASWPEAFKKIIIGGGPFTLTTHAVGLYPLARRCVRLGTRKLFM